MSCVACDDAPSMCREELGGVGEDIAIIFIFIFIMLLSLSPSVAVLKCGEEEVEEEGEEMSSAPLVETPKNDRTPSVKRFRGLLLMDVCGAVSNAFAFAFFLVLFFFPFLCCSNVGTTECVVAVEEEMEDARDGERTGEGEEISSASLENITSEPSKALTEEHSGVVEKEKACVAPSHGDGDGDDALCSSTR